MIYALKSLIGFVFFMYVLFLNIVRSFAYFVK